MKVRKLSRVGSSRVTNGSKGVEGDAKCVQHDDDLMMSDTAKVLLSLQWSRCRSSNSSEKCKKIGESSLDLSKHQHHGKPTAKWSGISRETETVPPERSVHEQGECNARPLDQDGCDIHREISECTTQVCEKRTGDKILCLQFMLGSTPEREEVEEGNEDEVSEFEQNEQGDSTPNLECEGVAPPLTSILEEDIVTIEDVSEEEVPTEMDKDYIHPNIGEAIVGGTSLTTNPPVPGQGPIKRPNEQKSEGGLLLFGEMRKRKQLEPTPASKPQDKGKAPISSSGRIPVSISEKTSTTFGHTLHQQRQQVLNLQPQPVEGAKEGFDEAQNKQGKKIRLGMPGPSKTSSTAPNPDTPAGLEDYIPDIAQCRSSTGKSKVFTRFPEQMKVMINDEMVQRPIRELHPRVFQCEINRRTHEIGEALRKAWADSCAMYAMMVGQEESVFPSYDTIGDSLSEHQKKLSEQNIIQAQLTQELEEWKKKYSEAQESAQLQTAQLTLEKEVLQKQNLELQASSSKTEKLLEQVRGELVQAEATGIFAYNRAEKLNVNNKILREQMKKLQDINDSTRAQIISEAVENYKNSEAFLVDTGEKSKALLAEGWVLGTGVNLRRIKDGEDLEKLADEWRAMRARDMSEVAEELCTCSEEDLKGLPSP